MPDNIVQKICRCQAPLALTGPVQDCSADTGKSLSEAPIFASTNPQYDYRLFIELQVAHVVYRNCF